MDPVGTCHSAAASEAWVSVVSDAAASVSSLSLAGESLADAPAKHRRPPQEEEQQQQQHPDHSATSRLDSLPCELLARIAGLLPPNEVPCSLRLVCHALAAALRTPAPPAAASSRASPSTSSSAQTTSAPSTAAAAASKPTAVAVAAGGWCCPFTTIRLSHPVPPPYFAASWGPAALAAGATRALTLAQRQRLLCLTAATGVVANLEIAEAAAALTLDGAVAAAAASRNQVATLRWLKARGCAGCPGSRAMTAAAAAGAVEALGWMWGPSRPLGKGLLAAAAAAGSEAACEWLLDCSCPW